MNREIDVRKFGVSGDGVTLNTEALQKAIDSLENGDTLVFSEGCYVTGTIALKSNITLKIERNAQLCGSRNIAHYRANGFYHNEFHETVSLIYALDAENIRFTGGGSIQLSGDAFMNFGEYGIDSSIDRGTVTKEITEQCVVCRRERPTQPIFFNNCKNIHFDNIFILNSPCWTLTFSNCENIEIENIFIDNHPRIPNNDGLHFTASKNIRVTNSTFLCGDDCIAATCITNRDGICENIEISDCLMSSRSAAVRFGHLYSKVQNAVVRDIRVIESNRAVCIFAGDGGFVDNVKLENIFAESRIFSGNWWGKGEGFVLCSENTTGKISGVTFKNCSFAEENPSVIAGSGVYNVSLDGCKFKKISGNAHGFYRNKLDLAPNIGSLESVAFKANEKLYILNTNKEEVILNGTDI